MVSPNEDIPTLVAKIHDHRFDNYGPMDLAEEVEKFRAGIGPRSIGAAVDALRSVAHELATTDQTLRAELGKLGVQWQSPAGEQAGTMLTEHAGFSQHAGEKVEQAAQMISGQGESFTRTLYHLPDSSALRDGGEQMTLGDDLASLIGYETDHARTIRIARETRSQAVEVLNTYAKESADRLSSPAPITQPAGLHLAPEQGAALTQPPTDTGDTPTPDVPPADSGTVDAAPTPTTPAAPSPPAPAPNVQPRPEPPPAAAPPAQPSAPAASAPPAPSVSEPAPGPPADPPPRQSGSGGINPGQTTPSGSGSTAPSSTGSAHPAPVGGFVGGVGRGGSGRSAGGQRSSGTTGGRLGSGSGGTTGAGLGGGTASPETGDSFKAREAAAGSAGTGHGSDSDRVPSGGSSVAKPGPATGGPHGTSSGVGGKTGAPTPAPAPGSGDDPLAKGKLTGTGPQAPAAGGSDPAAPAAGAARPSGAGGAGLGAGAAAIGTGGTAGALAGQQPDQDGTRRGSCARPVDELPIGQLAADDELAAREAAELDPDGDEEQAKFMERAAPQEVAAGQDQQVRKFGIDDNDLFTDQRMVAPDLLGDDVRHTDEH